MPESPSPSPSESERESESPSESERESESPSESQITSGSVPSSLATSATPATPTPTSLADRRRAAIAGHTGDIDTARSLLDHADPRVRATALGALNRAGGLEPVELRRALTDPDSSVRRRAGEETARWHGADELPEALPRELAEALIVWAHAAENE